jgi:ADP-ribose pyrophosphatase YjhB (NUDIX family)
VWLDQTSLEKKIKTMRTNIVINKVGVLVEKSKKLLLIKELNTADGKYYWNILKGTFEPEKDKSYVDAAVRECKEEAGVDVKITHLLSVMYLSDQNKNKYVNQYNFIASIKKGTPHLSSEDEQEVRGENIIEIKFFDHKELVKLKKEAFINERAFLAVKDWLKDLRYDVKLLKFV